MHYYSRDLQILQELIHPDAQILPTDHRRPQLILQETEAAKPYSVIVRYSDKTEAIAVKADRFPVTKPFFANSRKECRRSDYLIFANTPQGNYIICLELKAGSANNTDIITQLKGSQCLAAYCCRIGQVFWNQADFLRDYQYRFVSLKKLTLSKSTSRPSSQSPARHDCPQTPLTFFSRPELQLHELL